MTQYYEPEFKKKIVRLHLEEGRSLKGLASEYGVSKASISNWTKQFREECQTNEKAQTDYDFMKENLCHEMASPVTQRVRQINRSINTFVKRTNH